MRYCTRCWAPNAMEATACVLCGAPLVGPELDGLPYVDKLLVALCHPEPETRARAATLLGVVGEPGDARVIRALTAALATDDPEAGVRDVGFRAAVAAALGRLRACEAYSALRRLALDEESALSVGFAAVEALAQLAQDGCDQAGHSIEVLAREAGRAAIRREACTALARLNEPR